MDKTTVQQVIQPCVTCRYYYGSRCVHRSVGYDEYRGLNHVQSAYAVHDEKMCGDSRRYYERKVQKVTEVKPLVKVPFITRLINETMKG